MKQPYSLPLPFMCDTEWPDSFRLISRFLIMGIVILFSANLFAQNLPSPSSCSSKDLELVGASLPPPSGDPCACGNIRTLMLTINNKTGSTRTSFALWGTLKIFNPDGSLKSSESIFACAGPIPKNAISTLASSKQIQIGCGESLIIENLFLAWTSASPNETCAALEASPSTINPKCGTLPSIQVISGVDAGFVVSNATCAAAGSIAVSPFGGVAPYKVRIGADERTNIAANTSTTFGTLPAGNYTIVITDSRPCSTSKFRTVNAAGSVSVSAGTNFTKTCLNNTAGQGIGETSEAGHTYSWAPTAGLSNTTIANPTANPISTTVYTVTKTNSTTNCTAVANVTVTVDNANVTVNAGNNFTKTCVNNTAGQGIGETPESGYTYSWSPTAGLSNSTIANPNANPDATTVYTVTKTNTSSNCSGTANVTVTVNTTAPSFTVCVVHPTLCSANGGSVTITASGGTGLQYSIDGGQNYQNENTFNNLGAGSVTGIKVRNSDGCVSAETSCANAPVCAESGSAITSNGNQETARTAPLVIQVRESDFTIKAFPNPFSNHVRFVVNIPEAGTGSLELINMMGQKVKTIHSGQFAAGTSSFDVVLPAVQTTGLVYVLRMGGKQLTGKLLQVNQ